MKYVHRMMWVVVSLLLLWVTPPPAQALERITVKEMQIRANIITTHECFRRRFIRTPRGPVRVYDCVYVKAACRWHPPLRIDTGFCIGNFRLQAPKLSFLDDIVCARKMWFRKYRSGVQLMGSSHWYCREVHRQGPSG